MAITDNRTAERDYQLPDGTNLLSDDVLRLIAALQAVDTDVAALFAGLATKAAAVHQHQIADITSLQTALDGKAAASHQHALNDLTDVDVSTAANGQFFKRVGAIWVPVTPQIGDVSGLQAKLNELEMDVGSLDSVVVLKGTWDASLGVFPGGGTAKTGWSYIVSVGGTVNGVEFTANDRIVAIKDNASTTTYAANWHKLDYTDQVLSVAGRTGDVTLGIGDIASLQAALDGKQAALGLAGLASQGEAEAGVVNDKAMTPLRVAQAVAAMAGGSVALQVFTSSGTYTPTAGMKFALVIATGGGAGGKGGGANSTAGAGGAPGGTAIGLFISAEIGASRSVTIGSGGSSSNAGGATVFMSMTANGGPSSGLAGGTASGGLLNIQGGHAGNGFVESDALGGYGGSSFWGGGGNGALSTSGGTNGGDALVPGSGGGGGARASTTPSGSGGSGADGVVFILEFL